MGVLSILSLIFSFSALVLTNDGLTSTSGCGDWELFKTKTDACLTWISYPATDYEHAQSICGRQNPGSYLLTVDNEEDQKFIEGMIRTNDMKINVWLGLKYEKGKHVWPNKTWPGKWKLPYNNWVSNTDDLQDDHCVQIISGKENFGQWAKVPCTKKGFFICEKSMTDHQKITEIIINHIRNDIIPIGMVQVQLPYSPEPSVLWPYMKWEDISDKYAGVFFRVVGRDSGVFGEEQEAQFPSLNITSKRDPNAKYSDTFPVPLDGKKSVNIFTGTSVAGFASIHYGLNFLWWPNVYNVAPRNMAIRVWKRVK